MIRNKTPNNERIIDLDGQQGNAFVLLGLADKLGGQLIDAGAWTSVHLKYILKSMKESDYINLVKTFDKFFGEYVILETNNEALLDALGENDE